MPLKYNSVIKQELSNPLESKIHRPKSLTCDTLNLPFVDDFSDYGIFPNSCRWTDSSVFVNDDFPVNPPSVGVATFDGVDRKGNPYNPSSTSYGPADTLTSKPIDLNYISDTTIWLSFFYQPQGLGYAPAAHDSLVLELYGSDSVWHRVWSKTGSGNTAFVQKMVHISDPLYLFRGFRFRFMNYASLSGMLDQWNLDYVRLDRSRSASDTAITNDVTFVKRGLSVLKNYQSVPYRHYMHDTIAVMDTSKIIQLKNLGSSNAAVNHEMEFLRDDFSLLYSTGPSSVSIPGGGTATSQKNFSAFHFPSFPSQDSLLCYTRNIISTPDNNMQNDTLLEKQELCNYYAYDDGTAENGYGLSVAAGQIAYRFDLLMPDTLRGIQMKFVHVDDDIHLHLFNLELWTSLTSSSTTLMSSLHPYYGEDDAYYQDSINQFHTYLLDNPVPVSGTIYIGWTQLDQTILRLGLDRNINSNSNMFFNISGTWQNSSIAGSWMMRPVFGKASDWASVGDINNSGNIISVYPNPVSQKLTVNYLKHSEEKIFYSFIDVMGKNILSGIVESRQINVSKLQDGIYVVIFSDNNHKRISSKKIIVSH